MSYGRAGAVVSRISAANYDDVFALHVNILFVAET